MTSLDNCASIMVTFIALFIASCNTATRSNNMPQIDTSETNCLPHNINDTFSFAGVTHYSDKLDKFDTTYFDTVKIFQSSADSFYYFTKQVKYKEIPHFEGQESNDVTIVELYYHFEVNGTNSFKIGSESQYVKLKSQVTFPVGDSICFTEVIDRASEGKREDRVFKGIKFK